MNVTEIHPGQRVTVAGLGRFGGGIAVSRWLVERGANVLVTDLARAEKLESSIAQLADLHIEYRLGEHRRSDFTDTDLVVTSPAVPISNEYLQAARNAGVPITTEICLFIERCRAKIIGVTGTKGKSTTTALLSRMLATKRRVFTGGNIGRSLLIDLPSITSDDVVLLELSSFMLEHLGHARWSPHVAVVNMITVDHVEWHGSIDAYVNAKRNIVRYQRADDFAVLSDENEASAEFAEHTPATIVKYGVRDRRPFALVIPGEHNQLNAQAAFAAAEIFGVDWRTAQEAIRDFSGLPNRLELVYAQEGIRWFNDSIATVPEAAIAALDSFERGRVIQIVGGYDKKLDLSAMCEALARHVKAVLTIGALGPNLARRIREIPGIAIVHECRDLSSAVEKARAIAQSGDVVLLSPGCASYDQFDNFEQRGQAFARFARAAELNI